MPWRWDPSSGDGKAARVHCQAHLPFLTARLPTLIRYLHAESQRYAVTFQFWFHFWMASHLSG